MKFGKLEDVSEVDFSLPDDHISTTHFFNQIDKPASHSIIYTGATSWNNDAWKGRIYPEKTPKTRYIQEYGRQFNSIELNATHYRTPSDSTIEKWVQNTPDDFRFCPKILQAISHRNDMLANTELVDNFILQLSKIEGKMGQCFIQLPPYFKEKNLEYLDQFLRNWPREIPLAVEVRDGALHEEKAFADYISVLQGHNATPLITDVSGRRDLMHMSVIDKRVFVRWVGNGLVPSDYSRIDEWIERLESWTKKGVEEIYFMLHQPENDKTPEIAEYLYQKITENSLFTHRGPRIIKQHNLF